MESNTQTLALAALAGLFCLLAVALLGGLAFYSMRRARPVPPPRQAPAPPSVAASRLSPIAPPRASGAALPGGPDAGYDEEEMPTVVMTQRNPQHDPQQDRPKAPPPPSQAEVLASRTRGATIIAFDDEDDDS